MSCVDSCSRAAYQDIHTIETVIARVKFDSPCHLMSGGAWEVSKTTDQKRHGRILPRSWGTIACTCTSASVSTELAFSPHYMSLYRIIFMDIKNDIRRRQRAVTMQVVRSAAMRRATDLLTSLLQNTSTFEIINKNNRSESDVLDAPPGGLDSRLAVRLNVLPVVPMFLA